MKSRVLILSLVVAVITVACGRDTAEVGSTGGPTVDSVPDTTTATTIRTGDANRSAQTTLGVTPEEFVVKWNSFLHAHDFLQVEVPDGAETLSPIQFSDDWNLDLAVDPQSGELTQAQLRSSLNEHTDQLIMRYLSWLSLVQATNPSVTVDVTEGFDWVTDRIGIPNPESDQLPDGFESGEYSSEGEIEGVLDTFEKSGYDVILTAVPAP